MSLYTSALKPLLFKCDPENVHNHTMKMGVFCGKHWLTRQWIKLCYAYKHPMLEITVSGIHFPNPVGLAAGFDKNAKLTDILPSVGFGFAELGSVTGKPCVGNPKPRLWRLPKDKGIAVWYGLCNEGAKNVAKRLRKKKFDIPMGMSVAKTNDASIKGKDSIQDYCKAYQAVKSVGSYITINISCPNTGDGRSFQDPKLLEQLLKKIGKLKKPVFVKIGPDLKKAQVDKLIALVKKYNLAGFVVANLTHSRLGLKTAKEQVRKTKGGISGLHTQKKSNELLRYIYKKTKGSLILIGVGGIFTAEDAYEKIKDGASLVQLITGMIYKGPGVIKEINKGLVRLLEADGYNSIADAIGANVR